ncbi:MAG: heme biosynthesis HemY N-terminal domain-containing protein [Alphaproteobacteria bacterium]
MIRAAFIFVLIGCFVWLAVWFAGNPGYVDIRIAGLQIRTQAGIFVLGLVVVIVVAAVLYRLWRFIRYVPGGLLDHRRAGRRQRGYQALTQGMVAVAAGDADEAKKFARKADVLLKEPPLTMLLSAQAAQLEGDEGAARRYFEEMLKKPDMAFLGLRGLLMQAVRRDDRGEALRLAERAFQLRPDTPWVLTRLFSLQVAAGKWSEANDTTQRAVRAGVITQDAGRRRRAVLAVALSDAAARAGDSATALKQARVAHDLAPDLVAATVVYMRCLAAAGKMRRAVKLTESAWALEPHPDIAAAYKGLGGEDEPPLARVKRFQRLCSIRPDRPESHYALAEVSLAADLWGEARRHLETAAGDRPTARHCRLMAELEERETGNLEVTRHWLDRAVSAPPGEAWYCSECGAVAGAWAPCCDNCSSFDSLKWTLPPGAGTLQIAPPDNAPTAAAAALPGKLSPVSPATLPARQH